MSDRGVYARTEDGGEIVCYDQSGKWYWENADYRKPIDFDEAVRLASTAGAVVFSDRLKRKPPESVALIWCPVCGRTNRHTPLKIDGKHFSQGERCPGLPVVLVYRLEG